MANIIETGIEYAKITDVKYMRSYLMQLNDDLRYMIYNIDLDNFSEEGVNSFMEFEDLEGGLSESVEALEAHFKDAKNDIESKLSQNAAEIELLLTKGDVTNSINISSEKIKIQASRLHVYSDNFYLDDDILRINGTMIAKEGSVGGVSIAKDSSGKQYLQGSDGSALSSGRFIGTKGYFGTFKCSDEFFMYRTTAYLANCRIQSEGLYLENAFATGELRNCHYSESTDAFTNWQPMNIKGNLYVTGDIHVGRNMDDSGTVTCLTLYSSIDGERPGDYEDSDILLKKDTAEIDEDEAYEFIKELRPVSFNYIGDDKKRLGVIAQDILRLQEKYGEFGIVKEEDGFHTVSYTRFVPIMAAALRKIDRLIGD